MSTLPHMPADEQLAASFLENLDAAYKITPQQLLRVVRDFEPVDETVKLPDAEKSFWDAGMAGINGDPTEAALWVELQREQFLSSSLTVTQVSHLLGKDPSTIRHYKKASRLYAFVHEGKLRFPDWQFVGEYILPGLDKVLPSIADSVRPEAVTGFFVHPNVDLVVNGEGLSPCQWLGTGRSPEPVERMASDLGKMV